MADWGGGSANPVSDNEWGDGGANASAEFGAGIGFQDEFSAGASADADASGSFGGPGGGGGGGGGACFNCGEHGHQKSDCTKPRVVKCRHCDQTGHVIKDCPTAPPQEFTGECRVCHETGHMAKDCEKKPPTICNNCGQEGHVAFGCENARKIDRSGFREVNAEMAWQKIMQGIEDKEVTDVKEGIQEYVKSQPATTYVDLEESFRGHGVQLYLIALENPKLLPTHTHMDLQGNLNKKYRVNYRWNDQPLRPREYDYFPTSAEDNLERLRDAGEPVERGVPKCLNCGEFGHTSKRCQQEKVEKEHLVITCFNCSQPGHRNRDCPEPRKTKFGCKNCGQDGHVAKECPEPRRASDDVECRKCGGTGHFAKDCPQGGDRNRACFNCGEEGHNSRDCTNEKKTQCRNCDEFGHMSKECPKPRDYSRVKCNLCGKMGHTQVRCKATKKQDDDESPDKSPRQNTEVASSADAQGGVSDVWESNTAAGSGIVWGADQW